MPPPSENPGDEAASAAPLYRRADGVVLRRAAGEALLIPVRGRVAQLQSIFVLDVVGEAVWEELAAPRTLDSLAARISERFRHPQEQVRADCREFLNELVGEELAGVA